MQQKGDQSFSVQSTAVSLPPGKITSSLLPPTGDVNGCGVFSLGNDAVSEEEDAMTIGDLLKRQESDAVHQNPPHGTAESRAAPRPNTTAANDAAMLSDSNRGTKKHRIELLSGAISMKRCRFDSSGAAPKPPSLRQTFLDVGQRGLSFAIRCSKCNMLYNPVDEDEALHRRYCTSSQRCSRAQPPTSLKTSNGASPPQEMMLLVEAILHLQNPAAAFRGKRKASLVAQGEMQLLQRSEVGALKPQSRSSCTGEAAVLHELRGYLLHYPPTTDDGTYSLEAAALLNFLGFDEVVAAEVPHAVVVVVDVVLQRLVSAVAGRPNQREHDPEVEVCQRHDGSTLCRTRRSFTMADICHLWICSAAVLRAAEESWMQQMAGTLLSRKAAVHAFFRNSCGAGASQSSQAPTSSMLARLENHRVCGMGFALHLFAQQMAYCGVRSPSKDLSYSAAAIRQLGLLLSAEEPLPSTASSVRRGADGDRSLWLLHCIKSLNCSENKPETDAELSVEVEKASLNAAPCVADDEDHCIFLHTDDDNTDEENDTFCRSSWCRSPSLGPSDRWGRSASRERAVSRDMSP